MQHIMAWNYQSPSFAGFDCCVSLNTRLHFLPEALALREFMVANLRHLGLAYTWKVIETRIWLDFYVTYSFSRSGEYGWKQPIMLHSIYHVRNDISVVMGPGAKIQHGTDAIDRMAFSVYP